MLRGDSSFQVLAKINYNGYKLDLQGKYGVSNTFNVVDLSSFHVSDDLSDLRTKPFEEKGTDMDIIGNVGILTIMKSILKINESRRPNTKLRRAHGKSIS